MHTLDIDGSSIHYEVLGHGGRTPLLCLHGGGCLASDFHGLADRFGTERRLVCPDQRGHGASADCGGPYGPVRLAEDAEALALELGLDRVVVVGHSMGGPIALELLRRGNLGVVAFIAIDAPVPLTEAMAGGMGMLLDKFKTPGEGMTFYRQFMASVVGFTGDPARASALLDSLCTVAPHVIAPLVEGVVSYDGTGPLAAARIPMLQIDCGLDVCDLKRLAELRPDARIESMAGTGHYPHLEAPETVATLMREFLTCHDL